MVTVLVVGLTGTSALAGDRDGTGGYKYTIYGEELQFPTTTSKETGLGGADSSELKVRDSSSVRQFPDLAHMLSAGLWRYVALIEWLR